MANVSEIYYWRSRDSRHSRYSRHFRTPDIPADFHTPVIPGIFTIPMLPLLSPDITDILSHSQYSLNRCNGKCDVDKYGSCVFINTSPQSSLLLLARYTIATPLFQRTRARRKGRLQYRETRQITTRRVCDTHRRSPVSLASALPIFIRKRNSLSTSKRRDKYGAMSMTGERPLRGDQEGEDSREIKDVVALKCSRDFTRFHAIAFFRASTYYTYSSA